MILQVSQMKNDIKIFYHVLLENHWYTVVKEQLD